MNDGTDKEKRITQLRKGILELAVMGTLYHEQHYGYSLARVLSGDGEISLKEGTIYPILTRLAREGLVQSQWVESGQGPPRKYYSLTGNGRRLFEELMPDFDQLVSLVKQSTNRKRNRSADGVGERISIRKEEGL